METKNKKKKGWGSRIIGHGLSQPLTLKGWLFHQCRPSGLVSPAGYGGLYHLAAQDGAGKFSSVIWLGCCPKEAGWHGFASFPWAAVVGVPPVIRSA